LCQTFDDEKGIDQEQYKSQIVSVCKVVRRAYSKYEQAWIFEATQEVQLVWKSVIQEHSNTSQPNIGGGQMQLSQKECKDKSSARLMDPTGEPA
jgi:hypothetical protein